MRRYARLIAPALLLSIPTAAALAQDAGFRTPSQNIHCAVGAGANGTLACTIMDIDGAPTTPRPAGCDGAYGHRFSISGQGPVTVDCGAPGPIPPGDPVMNLGETRDFGGISCSLDRSALLCSNADGHGFLLSRSRQTLF